MLNELICYYTQYIMLPTWAKPSHNPEAGAITVFTYRGKNKGNTQPSTIPCDNAKHHKV